MSCIRAPQLQAPDFSRGWLTIRIFLQDLYNAWRRLEGLPVAPDYATAKLGFAHGSRSVEAMDAERPLGA